MRAYALAHQCRDMRRGAFAQRVEIVAAFEGRHDAPVGVAVGEFDEALRDPGVIVGDELQLRQRVAGVGVEAGGDQQQLRTEQVELGQQPFVPGGAKLPRARAGRQRRVEDVAVAMFVGGAGAGV